MDVARRCGIARFEVHKTTAEFAVGTHYQILAGLADFEPAVANCVAGKIAAQGICGSIQQGIFFSPGAL
jgi:hypothetical protein